MIFQISDENDRCLERNNGVQRFPAQLVVLSGTTNENDKTKWRDIEQRLQRFDQKEEMH